MTTLKQGDLIKDRDGNTPKILEVYGELVFVSWIGNHNSYAFTSTEAQLKNEGYTWDTPACEPEIGQLYRFINGEGDVVTSTWDNEPLDNRRRNHLGIYQTDELCEAALLEIRRKLGK